MHQRRPVLVDQRVGDRPEDDHVVAHVDGRLQFADEPGHDLRKFGESVVPAPPLAREPVTTTGEPQGQPALIVGEQVHGCAVMRFDFTGLGESEGAFATSTLGHDACDIAAAASH